MSAVVRGMAGGGVRSMLLLSIVAAACSSAPRPAPLSPRARVGQEGQGTIVGVASWYGPGFDGHRTASGEIYDQEELTAASVLFPLGSRVMVTDLDNDRSVEVRINDRGPFVDGRKIDLSHKAARILGMIQPGTAPVRMTALAVPPGSRPVGAPLSYYVQVGSYSRQSNAERVGRVLAAYYRDVRVEAVDVAEKRFYRVRMGGFATRDEAARRAADAARFGYPMVLVSE